MGDKMGMDASDTSTPQQIGDDELDRYLAGERSFPGAERVRGYLQPGSDVERLLKHGTRLLDSPPREPSVRDGWQALVAELGLTGEQPVVAAPSKQGHRSLQGTSRSRRLVLSVRSAAVASVAAVAAWVIFARSGAPSMEAGHHVYSTPAGRTAVIRLDDGSQVTLAPHTTLTVGPSATRARVVSLAGEAQFDIVSAANAPFIVRTPGVTTRVIGTRFTVRRYPDDRDTRVAVTSGKVVSGGARSLILVAGMRGRFTGTTASAIDSSADDIVTNWSDETLVFTHVTTATLLQTLGRWYDYDFHLTDTTLASKYVSGTFDIHASDATWKSLKALLHVNMTFDGRTITLRPSAVVPISPPLPERRTTPPPPPPSEGGR